MRTRRATVIQIRLNKTKPWAVSFYEEQKRKRKYFSSRIDAEKYANELNKELNYPEDFQISPEDRAVFFQIRNKLKSANLNFPDLTSILDRHITESVSNLFKPKISTEEAIEKFISNRMAKGLRATSIEGIKRRLPKIMQNKNIFMTQLDAQKLIDESPSPLHYKRILSAFFSFLVETNIIDENVFKNVKIKKQIKDKVSPTILSVEDAFTLFHELPDKWKPTFALMAFAGIRPSEVIDGLKDTIKIGDIDFVHKKITVRAEVAKDRKCRILENLPTNIWTWLEFLKGLPEPFNVAPNSYETYKRVKQKLSVRLPKDVLRHSFASYGYHHLGADHTVEIMGHITGFGVFAKHYKGLSNKPDSERYFSIAPSTVSIEIEKRKNLTE